MRISIFIYSKGSKKGSGYILGTDKDNQEYKIDFISMHMLNNVNIIAAKSGSTYVFNRLATVRAIDK